MSGFWNLVLIFSCMLVQPGRRWVTAQSPTETPVNQPHKEVSVNIGESATLQCCLSEKQPRMMAWFKQPTRKKPQVIFKFFSTSGETFYNGFQASHFQIDRYSNCFNMTILNTTQSDEAMYYCALITPYLVFGDGTFLKIKETSKPAVSDNSIVCEPTPYGNNTNMSTQENTVIGLGTAFGLCALLIFCLTYFILRRRKSDKIETSIEDYSGMRQIQESEAETVIYTAVQFNKKKAKAEKRKTGLAENCVYSSVK
ncbi:uncharacterized protein LOC131357879 [Hemibagrus wyckioides]|uniref:uncharacterized protein LOC131357879 n=1 Tax=Hemibagrus wyckioides TaxID=337641 RepID=UPI00266D9306|nr:uncharacterized protein LOC131357879 [Hemibagrus wyckioides]